MLWQSLPFLKKVEAGFLDGCRSLMEPHVQPRGSVSEQCAWSVIVWNNHCPLRVLEGCDTQSSLGGSKQVYILATNERLGRCHYRRVWPDPLFAFYSYSLNPVIWGDSWLCSTGCRRRGLIFAIFFNLFIY